MRECPPFPDDAGAESGPPQIVVVGLGDLGQGLVLLAARTWWLRPPPAGQRLRITLVDPSAEQKMASLLVQHRRLNQVCELAARELGQFLADPDEPAAGATVYVCLDSDEAGLAAGLALLQRARARRARIVVCLTHEAGLATLVRGVAGTNGGLETFKTYALLDRACTPEQMLDGTYEVLAQAIHEEYIRDQERQGETTQTNPSMARWEVLAEDLRASNRAQAAAVPHKLQAVGCSVMPLQDWGGSLLEFSRAQVELLAELEHERWDRERRAAGWKWGPKKDTSLKTSPYLIPWQDLPEQVKGYDRNTVRMLPAFLARAGLQIYRLK